MQNPTALFTGQISTEHKSVFLTISDCNSPNIDGTDYEVEIETSFADGSQDYELLEFHSDALDDQEPTEIVQDWFGNDIAWSQA